MGDTVRLTVFRGGDYREVEDVLPERPLLPGDLPQGTLTPLVGGACRPRRPCRAGLRAAGI